MLKANELLIYFTYGIDIDGLIGHLNHQQCSLIKHYFLYYLICIGFLSFSLNFEGEGY